MKHLQPKKPQARALARGCRALGLFFILSFAAWAFIPAAAGAGESTVAIPIPGAIEEGLEKAGIRLETRRTWLDDSTVWIAGSIIIAGLVIAYAIRRKKRK